MQERAAPPRRLHRNNQKAAERIWKLWELSWEAKNPRIVCNKEAFGLHGNYTWSVFPASLCGVLVFRAALPRPLLLLPPCSHRNYFFLSSHLCQLHSSARSLSTNLYVVSLNPNLSLSFALCKYHPREAGRKFHKREATIAKNVRCQEKQFHVVNSNLTDTK